MKRTGGSKEGSVLRRAPRWRASRFAVIGWRCIASCSLAVLILVVAVASMRFERALAHDLPPEVPGNSQLDAGSILLHADELSWPTGPYQLFLEDPTGELTLDDVLSPEVTDRFQPWPNGMPTARFSSSAYWARLHVQNVSNMAHDFLIEYDSPATDSVTFHRSVDGSPFTVVETGSTRPFDTREVPHRNFLFWLTLDQGQSADLLLRVQSNSLMSTGMTLWTADGFASAEVRRSLLWGAIYGVMVTIALFHFLMFFSLRERAYLWLAVWLISFSAFFTVMDGRAQRYLWPQGGDLADIAFVVTLSIVFAGLALFVRSYLSLWNRAPRIDKVLVGFVGVLLLPILLSPFVSYAVVSIILYALIVPTVVVAIFASWQVMRMGRGPARILVIALLLPLAFGLVDLGLVAMGIPLGTAMREWTAVSALAFALLITLALDDRLNDLRLENERNLRDLRASQLRLAQYMDAMPMAVEVRTADGQLDYWNARATAAMTPAGNPVFHAIQQASARNVVRVDSGERYPWEEFPFTRALQGAPAYADDLEVRVADNHVPIEIWANPIRGESGKVESVLSVVNDISVRRETQAQLDDMRLLYQSVVQDISGPICRFKADGEIVLANAAFSRYFCGSDTLPPNARLEHIAGLRPYLNVANLLGTLTPQNPVAVGEGTFANAQGDERRLGWSIRAIFDSDGIAREYQALAQDVTEARKAEQLMRDYQVELTRQVEHRTQELGEANRNLARRAEEISVIGLAAQALASATDPAPVLQQVAHLLARLLDAGGVGVSVYDHQAQTRTLFVWYPEPHASTQPADVGVPRPLHDYLYRTRLINERRTVVVRRGDETPEAEEIRGALEEAGMNMAVFTPLLSRSEVVGDLTFSNRRSEWSYSDPDRQLVETIAAQLASSLELGRLLKSEQRERKRAEGLQEVARVINRSLTPSIVMRDVLSEVARIVEFDGAAIWLREGDDLVMTQCVGIATRHQGLRIPLGTRSAINRVFTTGQTVAIANVLSEKLWAGWFPEDGLHAWMGAPMSVEGKVVGAIGLDRRRPGIDEDDVALLRSVADFAATAVVNARLFDQVQAATAIEERERLARDLHDAVTQTIFSANILSEVLPLQLQSAPEQAQATIEKLQMLTHSALAEMRSLLAEMRPSGLTDTSLDSLIRLLANALTVRSSVETTLCGQWNGRRLPDEVQLTFYRVAQEALNNVAKHADAAHATIELSSQGENVFLSVVDDGRGFDPAQQRPGHYGLGIIAERAASIGARLEIASRPGAGTRIVLEWQPAKEGSQ